MFLGVSPQTVYLWVERKQIPHLRVMGRNIRFLKSELEPFRAQFKQEVGNGKTSKHDGGLYKREGSKIWWMWYRDKGGVRRRESTLTEDWDEAQKCLRERLQARDNNTLPALRRGRNLLLGSGRIFIGELLQAAIPRAENPRGQSARAEAAESRSRESHWLSITADEIEQYLRGG